MQRPAKPHGLHSKSELCESNVLYFRFIKHTFSFVQGMPCMLRRMTAPMARKGFDDT